MPCSHISGSEHSITTRYFVSHIRLWYSHKICNIIRWHVLSKSLYIYTYPLTLFRWSSSQNCTFTPIHFVCHARSAGVWMMGCQPSCSSVSPHHDHMDLEMDSEAIIERVWICTWRLWSCTLGGHNRANLEAVTLRVWRYTWMLWYSEFGEALGSRDCAN